MKACGRDVALLVVLVVVSATATQNFFCKDIYCKYKKTRF